MTEVLKGKPVFDAMTSALTTKIAALKMSCPPKLAIIRVGKKADDLYYERSIQKTCAAIGMDCQIFEYEEMIEQQALESEVSKIANTPTIHGILVFIPLPSSLDDRRIRHLIPPTKDVDGLNVETAGKLYMADTSAFAPCTPAACMELLNFYDIPLEGKNCVIIGRSLTVGKPLGLLLLRENATVTTCHSKTRQLAQICQRADILITAIGRAKMITPEFTNKNQVVLDVGINKDPDKPGSYCGDVDFEKVAPRVSKITPVPGGIGSITTAILCQHTVVASNLLFHRSL